MAVMRRRDLVMMLGASVAWPHATRAQAPDRLRRVGVLSPYAESDRTAWAMVESFRAALRQLGWTPGENIQLDLRWAGADSALLQAHARALVAWRSDVLLATNSIQTVHALRRETDTIPIVFANASDPVEAGLVASLARPGGNITGFTSIQATTNTKWLALLKELVPGLTRAMVLLSPEDPSNPRRFDAIEAAGGGLGVAVVAGNVAPRDGIERAIASFAATGRGLIVLPNAAATTYRDTIIAAAATHRLPAIYPNRIFTAAGGLMSYGSDLLSHFPRAAAYVDRILRGEKPADLPIQAPARLELVINLGTAAGLGIDVSAALLAGADDIVD